jgi:hypothetical protein
MARSVAHRAPKKRASKRIIAIVVAAVVALLVVGSAYAIATRDDPDSSSASGGSGGAGGDASPSAGSTPSAKASDDPGGNAGTGDDSSLAACAAHVSKAEAAVSAASTGVRDWHTHVQARTDMYAGRISVERMDALWKRSRLAGPADQARFHAALRSYEATSPCGDLAAVPQGDGKAAQDCVTRARAATKAVDAARAAMADWKSHLDHMASYARGGMSSEQAQTMWVEAWRDAPPHITAYEQARKDLAKAPACSDAS